MEQIITITKLQADLELIKTIPECPICWDKSGVSKLVIDLYYWGWNYQYKFSMN